MGKKRSIVIFLNVNPFLVRYGALRRCFEIMRGFKDLGFKVILASSPHTSFYLWDAQSIRGIQHDWGIDVRLFRLGYWAWKRLALKRRILLLRTKGVLIETLRNEKLSRWFNRLINETHPEVVLVNYAKYGFLLEGRRDSPFTSVIENHDLVSLNEKMQLELKRFFIGEQNRAGTFDERVLQEDYFEQTKLSADAEEFRIYDRYDITLAISKKEAGVIKEKTQNTKVIWLPMTLDPSYLDNTYNGCAIFTGGPNFFNVQGYFYFVKRVLPLIREKAPDFLLEATNMSPCLPYTSEPGVTIHQFIPDLDSFYAKSSFLICPLLAGTGQKVKIVEAMAHGLAVVATKHAQEDSPLEHGVSGFVANSVAEFAEYTIRLWKDKSLRKKMGEAAREKIAAEFSHARLLRDLSEIFNAGRS